jgi:Predicted nucleotide-binding protein containing TIR-like domain
MPESAPKRIFIIYGHDQAAYATLRKFIKSLGLTELAFERVADEFDDPNPFIAEVVMKGIDIADAVIALFTPDERAALYSPDTADAANSEARWQPRPNVIFEAGVALGLAPERTILVTLGSDIRLFSDLSGKHFIDLTGSGAKERLRRKLSRVLKVDFQTKPNWLVASVSGDFEACLRKRWEYYDELDDLEKELRNTAPYGKKKSLFDIVQSVAVANLGTKWEKWTSEDFMDEVYQTLKYSNDSADSTYYYLIITGFLTFKEIEQWWAPRCHDGYENCEEFFANSVEFSKLTTRAVNLLYKIQRLAGA